MASSDVDVLFEVRTAFYLGNYQHCITEAQKLRVGCEWGLTPPKKERPRVFLYLKPPTAALGVERDVLMYRSYIAQRKYAVVVDEVKSSSASELQAVKLLAQYLHSPGKR